MRYLSNKQSGASCHALTRRDAALYCPRVYLSPEKHKDDIYPPGYWEIVMLEMKWGSNLGCIYSLCTVYCNKHREIMLNITGNLLVYHKFKIDQVLKR